MARTIAVLLTLSSVVLAAPDAGAAQTGPGIGGDGEVGAALSARLGVTWLGDRSLPIGAIAGTLRLTDRVELGGEAVLGLEAIRLSPRGSPDRSELTTGYGGLLVRWRPAGDVPGVRWGGSLQIGAGTARVTTPLAEVSVAAENFFVLEPRISALFRQDHRLRFSAHAGYRITAGADALPGIRTNELRGASISMGAQFVFGPAPQL